MVLRGPRACGLRPRLWLLVEYIPSDNKITERDWLNARGAERGVGGGGGGGRAQSIGLKKTSNPN